LLTVNVLDTEEVRRCDGWSGRCVVSTHASSRQFIKYSYLPREQTWLRPSTSTGYRRCRKRG